MNVFPQRGHLILNNQTTEQIHKNKHKFKRKEGTSTTNRRSNNSIKKKAMMFGSFDTVSILFSACLYLRFELNLNPFRHLTLRIWGKCERFGRSPVIICPSPTCWVNHEALVRYSLVRYSIYVIVPTTEIKNANMTNNNPIILAFIPETTTPLFTPVGSVFILPVISE